MLKNYLKIGLRNLYKNKTYATINIFGLAVGMSCFLLILFYVQDEYSFDSFHTNAEEIYRVTEVNSNDGEVSKLANAYSAIGPALANDFPEIESFVRIHFEEYPVDNGPNLKFQEKGLAFADSTLWDVLSFEALEGNPAKALSEPFSMVITESTALKYFGEESAIGQVLRVDNQQDYKVSAVIKDVPKNSHLQFDILASFISLSQVEGGWKSNNWYWPPMYTYVRIPKNVDPEQVEGKFKGMVEKYLGALTAEQRGFELQPLSSIHTDNSYANELGQSTNETYLYILSVTALLILVIAGINFMNLSMAQSISRSGEVGVRKVFGAQRGQITWQYLLESILVTCIASVFALGLFLLAIPMFNGLTGKSLEVPISQVPLIAVVLVLMAVIIGVLSGIYPAFFLSGFSPAAILKGKMAKQGGFSKFFKKALVTFQFIISACLIISTFIIYFQLDFLRNSSLGFDTEQTIVLEVRDYPDQTRLKVLKDRLEQLPQVSGTSVSARVPGHEGFYDYNVLPEGESVENNMVFIRIESDLDFASLYQLEISSGRLFDPKLGTDSLSYLINETAAKKLGWDEADLNKKLNLGSLNRNGQFQVLHSGKVVGVVKDFNFTSLHNEVDPVVISIIPADQPYMMSKLSVKLMPGDMKTTISQIEREWEDFATSANFEFFFLDDNIQRLYEAEEQLGEVFLTFSGISIFLACLGLFALTTLLANQMRKEIGIRKVLGATVSNIIFLMSKGFLMLIMMSFVLASLIAYFMMHKWLEDFAFHVEIKWWYFLVSGLVLTMISISTISLRSVKAATGNPVDAIRYE